jgi:hypothetical protein
MRKATTAEFYESLDIGGSVWALAVYLIVCAIAWPLFSLTCIAADAAPQKNVLILYSFTLHEGKMKSRF